MFLRDKLFTEIKIELQFFTIIIDFYHELN